MAPIRKPSKLSTGGRYASQVIFYAGKHKMMLQRNLHKIGTSTNFHDLLVKVCKEDPKTMRCILKEGDKACEEGLRESEKDKMARNKAEAERIKLYRKRQNRADASKTSKKASDADNDEDNNNEDDESEIDVSDDDEAMDDDDGDGKSKSDSHIKPETRYVSQEPEGSTQVDKFERELALVRGEPCFVDENHCRKKLALGYVLKRQFDVNGEFKALLEKTIMKLDPDVVKDSLLEYLQNRLETAGSTKAPVLSASCSIEDLLDALHVLGRISEDAVIRRATAQIMLYHSVSRDSSDTVCHLQILRETAKKKAGNVSDKEITKIFKSYERDYNGGKRWLSIVDMFGGHGIVILFVVAGVGPWYVTQGWTEYQRACLSSLAPHLCGTRKLVNILGPGALEQYCLNGHLGEDTVERIRNTEFVET